MAPCQGGHDEGGVTMTRALMALMVMAAGLNSAMAQERTGQDLLAHCQNFLNFAEQKPHLRDFEDGNLRLVRRD